MTGRDDVLDDLFHGCAFAAYVDQAIEEVGKVRGTPAVMASRSALATVLRRGVSGARAIGGNEVFDVRTRLDQTVRLV